LYASVNLLAVGCDFTGPHVFINRNTMCLICEAYISVMYCNEVVTVLAP